MSDAVTTPIPALPPVTVDMLRTLPQVDCPVGHFYAPGVYARQIFMPAGTLVLGRKHLTEHLNIVISGRARVMMSGGVYDITGPCTFTTKAGVRKALYILEDMTFMTIHATDLTDPAEIGMRITEDGAEALDMADVKRLTEGEGDK